MTVTIDQEALQQAHRKFAVDCFNVCWSLIEKADRTPEDIRTMVSLAMTSRWHWQQVETRAPVHFSRSEWQVSRALALAGQGAAALDHALSGLDCCEKNGIGDFDLAFAFESVARAHAVPGDKKAAIKYIELASQAARAVSKDEDRKYFFNELKTIDI